MIPIKLANITHANHVTNNYTDMNFIPTEPVELIFKAFYDRNYDIRIVGGAVRDILLGRTPKDIDFATTAKPNEIKDVCLSNRIHCVETGLKHGTLTAVIKKAHYEITTLRSDVQTDGRHAVVEFISDWKLDAERRDLTINAMSLSWEGLLYDYFNGLEDLRQKRLQFVNDPEMRIKEDYLRILRFFRFYGRIANEPADYSSFDQNTLKIISELAPNLVKIAVERIWTEMAQIFTGRFAPGVVNVINQLNIFEYCGWDTLYKLDVEVFEQYYNNAVNRENDPDVPTVKAAALLASFFENAQEAESSCRNLKLSGADRELCLFVVRNHRRSTNILLDSLLAQRHYKALVVSIYDPSRIHVILPRVTQLMLCEGASNENIVYINKFDIPIFPIKGTDIKGHFSGSNICKALLAFKKIWIESDYTATKDELLSHHLCNIKLQ